MGPAPEPCVIACADAARNLYSIPSQSHSTRIVLKNLLTYYNLAVHDTLKTDESRSQSEHYH